MGAWENGRTSCSCSCSCSYSYSYSKPHLIRLIGPVGQVRQVRRISHASTLPCPRAPTLPRFLSRRFENNPLPKSFGMCYNPFSNTAH
jgi:hypothetical protein